MPIQCRRVYSNGILQPRGLNATKFGHEIRATTIYIGPMHVCVCAVQRRAFEVKPMFTLFL